MHTRVQRRQPGFTCGAEQARQGRDDPIGLAEQHQAAVTQELHQPTAGRVHLELDELGEPGRER